MGEQVAAGSNGGVAQLGEHLPCKQGVKGSNPFISIRTAGAVLALHLENRILNLIPIKHRNNVSL